MNDASDMLRATLHPSALWLLLALSGRGAAAAEGALRPVDLRCEYRASPLGIDERAPRLSWALQSRQRDARGQSQTAYQILVASGPKGLGADKGDLWDTGKVDSDRSVHVPYAGRPLQSHLRCWWKVRAWDEKGNPGPWSGPALWSMGILDPSEWRASWIGLDSGAEESREKSPVSAASWIWHPEGDPAASAPVGTRHFRQRLEVPEGASISRATFSLTADNDFTLHVNGKKVGSGASFAQVFDFDVTGLLRPGRNVFALSCKNAGDAPNPAGLIGLLRAELSGRDPIVLCTDGSWRSSDKEEPGWESAELDDSPWKPAMVLGPYGLAPWGEVGRPDFPRLPARLLRREFELPGKVERAAAYVCGLGLFELELNRSKVGDHVLSPALTEYTKRCLYVTFDVTGSLREGRNAVGVHLGNGRFFAPRTMVPSGTRTYGYPKLLFHLRAELEGGNVVEVTSGEGWKLTAQGPIRANNEYDGEEYDARMEMEGWSRSGFDDSAWGKAELVKAPGGVVAAQMIEPIRVVDTLRPVAVSEPAPGTWVFDMGQNLVGWCRLTVSGPEGTRVSLRHSETLKPDGNLYLDNIRSARVTDVYTLRGKGVEAYEPRFTYHGFRYVEVKGFPGKPSLSSVEGRVVHDDMERAGTFSTSNALLNRIYRNIEWGVRGNYRSIPTDCPQRDERQGWLGDRSAESRGEAYLFNVAAFYSKWLTDIQDAQLDSGSIPDVAPPYWPLYSDNVTWPSSYVIIPGHLYDQYGDTRILDRHYATMKKWMRHMAGYLQDGILPRDTYGDWCVPPEDQRLIHSNDPSRKTAGDLIATAYFYHDLRLMARHAAAIGRRDDIPEWTSLAQKIRDAFLRKFFKPGEAMFDNGSQTSSVLPLAFGMVGDDHRGRVFGRLAEKIEVEGKGHIGTGLLGAQWLLRLLSDGGRPDLALGMAMKTDYPSWGYMVAKGATTIWELWNGDTADPAMNSGNHVMLVGDLLTWLHEYVAGIAPDPENPGFKHIIVRPHPLGDLTDARATRRSLYGAASVAWKLRGGSFTLELQVPPNTSATLHLPARYSGHVSLPATVAGQAPGFKSLGMKDGEAVYHVGSGTYEFSAADPREVEQE